jgi:hypothetical protein
MNLATWEETNGIEATRIYKENAVAAVSTVGPSPDGGVDGRIEGKKRTPGNINAFKHGLASIQKRREEGILTEHEEAVRQQILDGLIADKGGDDQISTATRILAEVIASDASWLMAFNSAIDHVIQNQARQNPRGLSQLDGYKRGLVNSLTGNLQKFGLDRVPRVKTLEDLLQGDETSENPTQDYAETINEAEVKS